MKRHFIKLLLINLLLFSCSNKYPLKLGGKYILDIDGNSRFCVIDSQNAAIINSEIVELNYDTKYIIAKQKPVDVILGKRPNSNINIETREKIIKESTINYYWIIDITANSTYGPLLENDYSKKRTELNIPQNLELKKL